MLKTSKDYTLYPVELLQIIKENHVTYTFVFSKPKELSWHEGAHMHLALNRFNETLGWFEKKDVRHLSIMTLEEEGNICITTRIHSTCSSFKEGLKKASVGEIFYLFKIDSRLELRREEKPLLFISSGVAIATIRPLIKAFVADSSKIPRIHHITIDSSGDYLFKNELATYESNPHITHQFTQSRVDFYSTLKSMFSQDTMLSFADAYIYILGSDEFILNVRDFLMEQGVCQQQCIFDKKSDFFELQ